MGDVMPSPHTTQRCAKFHSALAGWKRELFLIRFAGASIVIERAVLTARGQLSDAAVCVINVR